MVDKGNTKAPTMHWRWGSATLLLLAFLKKSNPNFTWEEFQWDNTVGRKQKQNNKKQAMLRLKFNNTNKAYFFSTDLLKKLLNSLTFIFIAI